MFKINFLKPISKKSKYVGSFRTLRCRPKLKGKFRSFHNRSILHSTVANEKTFRWQKHSIFIFYYEFVEFSHRDSNHSIRSVRALVDLFTFSNKISKALNTTSCFQKMLLETLSCQFIFLKNIPIEIHNT